MNILSPTASTESRVTWPEGKAFAFSVFDDTDLTTLRNGPAVHDLLAECGFRTTKSVWPLRGDGEPAIGGSTCEDPDYLAWVLRLQDQGFEIALHNVTFETSTRERTLRGLDRFQALSDERQDALEASGGACIMYTHFGSGFAPDGRLDPRFTRVMRRLAKRNG